MELKDDRIPPTLEIPVLTSGVLPSDHSQKGSPARASSGARTLR